jgi:hypothetical protein
LPAGCGRDEETIADYLVPPLISNLFIFFTHLEAISQLYLHAFYLETASFEKRIDTCIF